MRYSLQNNRRQYFREIAKQIPNLGIQIIVVTHVLSDRPELLDALSLIGDIRCVVAIPYSIDTVVLEQLNDKYTIITPSLDQLTDKHYLRELALQHISLDQPLVIVEIGGYFSAVIEDLKEVLGNKLLGIVEDTEAGHRQYENLDHLPCPIVSVARSSLKETEDFLVGNSCLFSTERLLREAGYLLGGKHSLVLGYGKVGRGVAHALMHQHCPVCVYDINPTRRIVALSEGFHIPEKVDALRKSEIIFGTTGNYSLRYEDLINIKHGAVLVSCSSKTLEFDLTAIEKHFKRFEVLENFDGYQNGDQLFYLLGKGHPINFLDGAVIGPVLALVQAELIFGIKSLCDYQGKNAIVEVNNKDRELLAALWLEYFCDKQIGYYRHA